MAFALGLAGSAPAVAEEMLGSLTLQDDIVFGHDGGGYSGGVIASALRRASAGDDGVAPPWFLRPALRWFGVHRSTLSAYSLAQMTFTPRDLSLSEPDPTDSPYLGALLFRSAEVLVHDGVADMVALNLGVIGPPSGAARTQRFVHRLTGSEKPQGWSSQVSRRSDLGVEAYRAWRFPWGTGRIAGASGELVAVGGGAVGNLESSAGASLLLRWGAGLDRSFPSLLPISARSGDPIVLGGGWFGYLGVSAAIAFNEASLRSDSQTARIAPLRRGQNEGVAGIAYGWARSSLTFSVKSANPLVESSRMRQSYGSLTCAWVL